MSKEHEVFLQSLTHLEEGISAEQDKRHKYIKNEKKRIENKPMSEITLAEQNWYTSQFGMTRFT